MKKNILVKTGERVEVIHHDAVVDDEGTVIAEAYDEEVVKPIMEAQTVDMTDEEVAELESQQVEEVEEETTIDDVVEALNILTEIVLGGDIDG